jgi:hypothetical protein
VHESHCPDIGLICLERNEPPQIHDQTLYVGELRVILDYAFTDNWAIEAQIPLKLTDTSIVYRRLDGTVITPAYGNIHHRNETLYGFGDPWLSARAAFAIGSIGLSAKAGITLPLGRTEEDPFALGRVGIEHQHLQFGTGTVNPVLSLGAAHRTGPIEVAATFEALFVLYENTHGYRAGHRFFGGLLASLDLFDWLTLSLGADLANEQPERWGGEVQTDGSLGRTDLLLGGGATVRVLDLDITLSVRIPAYVHIIMHEDEPGEVSYPGLFSIAIGRVFSF